MAAHLDAIGNAVCGRYEGDRPGLAVPDAGFGITTPCATPANGTGPLGIITAIACVADLNRRGARLPFAIEVVGFADEEGVRFASTPARQPGDRRHLFDESVLGRRPTATASPCARPGAVGLGPANIGAAARARAASCMAMSNCTSSRSRCWSSKTSRSAW